MFVTFDDFFENYRMQNQQQPNETVLNRGLLRLKRETRELKSLFDIVTGADIPAYNFNKLYELDEYVSHNGFIFKSKQDRNFQKTPVTDDNDWWEVVYLNVKGVGNSVMKHQYFVAEEGQEEFEVTFQLDGTPMVFSDGILLPTSDYEIVNAYKLKLIKPALKNEKIIIIAGVTYDSSLVTAKKRFVAEEGQYIFETGFEIQNPSVFRDGILIDITEYTYTRNHIELNEPAIAGQKFVIGNGSVIGAELYTPEEVDVLLDEKRDVSDSYSIVQTDNLLAAKANVTYVDAGTTALDTAKADKATSLDGYGILDAYTKDETNSLMDNKLDELAFNSENILAKLVDVDGAGSLLNADMLDDLSSQDFLRSNTSAIKYFNLTIQSDIVAPTSEILLNVDPDEPDIKIRKLNDGAITSEATVYTDKNTNHIMIVKEGYFKGSWEPSLIDDFGISNWDDYNWVVIVTPVLTGFEHDFNKDFLNGHTPFSGFDNEIIWDENQSEYHYGYLQNEIVKMQAIHRNNAEVIDIPAKYCLTGVLKTFSSHERVDQS